MQFYNIATKVSSRKKVLLLLVIYLTAEGLYHICHYNMANLDTIKWKYWRSEFSTCAKDTIMPVEYINRV